MTALIYGNGTPISQRLFALHQDRCDQLIAADGGAYSVLEHDVVPDVIVGDLDSFSDEAPAGTELIHDPDQETNDLQKALHWALAHRVTEATIVGAAGDRLDHNLNNLSVLLEFSGRFARLQLVDGFGRHVVVHTELALETSPGRTVSLYPLSGRVTGVTTEGLRYPLHGEDLEPGVRTGCLNEATGDRCRITVESGSLLVSVAHGS